MEYYTTNCYGYSTTYYTGSCLHARKRTGDDTLITCLHIAAFSKYVMRLFSIEQSITAYRLVEQEQFGEARVGMHIFLLDLALSNICVSELACNVSIKYS